MVRFESCLGFLLVLMVVGLSLAPGCGDEPAGLTSEEKARAEAREFHVFVRRHHLFRGWLQSMMAPRTFPEITLDELERSYLLHRLARTSGIRVTDEELREQLERMFVDRTSGAFSAQQYGAVLKRFWPGRKAEFERTMREYLELQQYVGTRAKEVEPTTEQVHAEYRERFRTYELEYTWKTLASCEERLRAIAAGDLEGVVGRIADDGSDFEAVMREAGLPVRRTPVLDRRRPPPEMPSAEELASEDGAIRRAAEARARDRFVMTRGFATHRSQPRPCFRPVLDPATRSAIVLHVRREIDPAPEEAEERELLMIRSMLRRQAQQAFVTSGPLSLEALRKELSFTRPELEPPESQPTPSGR